MGSMGSWNASQSLGFSVCLSPAAAGNSVLSLTAAHSVGRAVLCSQRWRLSLVCVRACLLLSHASSHAVVLMMADVCAFLPRQGYEERWSNGGTKLACVPKPPEDLSWAKVLGIVLGSVIGLLLAIAAVLMQVSSTLHRGPWLSAIRVLCRGAGPRAWHCASEQR